MKDENKTQPTSSKAKAPKSHLLIYKLITLLSVLIFIIVAGVLISIERNQDTSIKQMRTQLSALHQKEQIAQNQINHVASHVVNNEKTLQHLQAQAGRQDIDWILDEVNYLVRLASFDLQFNQNTQDAMLLLHTADQSLAKLKDPRLLPVRQSLADDMANLKAVPKVDVEGILLQLNAMSSEVNNLPIIATPESVQPNDKKTHHHHHKDTPSWKIHLEESWRQIRDLVVVQYHDQSVSQMITPTNRAYLDMHLQLLLSQAQWAVIHDKEKVYKQSLLEAKVWVRNYYVESSPKTKAMINSLQTLSDIDISPELPDVSDTLDVLNKVKQKFEKQNADNNAVVKTGAGA